MLRWVPAPDNLHHAQMGRLGSRAHWKIQRSGAVGYGRPLPRVLSEATSYSWDAMLSGYRLIAVLVYRLIAAYYVAN